MTRESAIKWEKEIKAFLIGQTIQMRSTSCGVWNDTDNPFQNESFEYRIKPELIDYQKAKEEAKKVGGIVECSNDGSIWFVASDIQHHFEYTAKYYRIRIIEKPVKRLPTIQEVEQWFLENRVFVYKEKNILDRIAAFDRNNLNGELVLFAIWKTIEMFCEEYTHLDGSSLYINENGK